ncbi:MAG: hypothetical protein QW430_05585 [Metallosphaera sp.]|uniref:hypothetical protein n=1 Tax=Metallosphaera sp. TaxID=2020860 RepID=UPI003161139F
MDHVVRDSYRVKEGLVPHPCLGVGSPVFQEDPELLHEGTWVLEVPVWVDEGSTFPEPAVHELQAFP